MRDHEYEIGPVEALPDDCPIRAQGALTHKVHDLYKMVLSESNSQNNSCPENPHDGSIEIRKSDFEYKHSEQA